ncbi:HAD superfamily hydrolase (TIGR01458 family) [Marinimicrobium koreense]|uniref:Haloacid dehalogenase-like hydrolase domain-containing protein 2 n=1 Tax=Marinimicrobium koreense TaxID=306545 RepID=A0A3N1NV65_9GAMM|nr:TIGR01458 family HAD-type hydrolase [Marinimicrobium koreense]ROQ19759.1 HAD superfamily hydrolase (TIGR01458 family) [Marinimicrobium koreense]
MPLEAAMNDTRIKAVFFDLSGVLYEGDRRIDGAIEAVAAARDRGLVLRFVTNTATKSREQLLEKLQQLGFDVTAQELFTAPDAALAYVREHQLTPYALVHPSIKALFGPLGDREPDCVVLGDARDELNYRNLNQAFRIAQAHKRLIAIGENKYFNDGDALCLDAGPFVRAVAWAADVEPVVMGKPNPEFFHQVVTSTGLPPEQCLMIGDDVFGDVEGALKAGLQARLVKTGKYQAEDEKKLSPAAIVLESVKVLPSML